jgi:hypothetical protein
MTVLLLPSDYWKITEGDLFKHGGPWWTRPTNAKSEADTASRVPTDGISCSALTT